MAGGCAWWGVCMVGGMHDRGHTWQGGMHGKRGGVCGGGCMVGVCVAGGVRAWHTVNERAVRILLECILVLILMRTLMFCR